MTDFHLRDEGTLILLTPLSDTAHAWALEHLPEDGMRWGLAFVIERRCFEPIYHALLQQGLHIGVTAVPHS
jgi:hypothetical protein